MTASTADAWTHLHAGQPIPAELVAEITADPSPAATCALLAHLRGTQPVTVDDADTWAARIPADQPARAAVAFRVAHLYLVAGAPDTAADICDQHIAGAPEALAGALGLVRAIAASRNGHIDVALHILNNLPTGDTRDDDWHTEYSAGNVTAHRIAVLTAAGRFDDAFAQLTDPALQQLSTERRRHVIADLHACTS